MDTRALKFMHKLRHDTFNERNENNINSIKPYVPMLVSDERGLIEEQFAASQKQLLSEEVSPAKQ